ncbi:MAG: FAD-dependent oxidoreductase, partial [Zoogloea sp.]|nr:FAD-dependent oxidoreductase [Zoogloea sp.]
MPAPILILGSGLAGYNLAREFRKLDKTTPLVIVSRDDAGFYSKPMLSNALAGNKTAASLVMKSADKMAEELNARILPRTAATDIDAAAGSVTLDNGETIAYRDLVLALGADPVRLPLAGDGAADVLSVNDLDDFARFAARLEGACRVAILGGGLIGCEFANDLLARGIAPTIVDLGAWPLSRLLPEEGGRWLRESLEAAGVCFRSGVSTTAVNRSGKGYAVELSDGSTLEADLVLSAVGLRPRTTLAAAAGLTVNRGIATNRLLATSAPNIHALGDCAEVEGLSLPFVMPIMQQAKSLAATLAGKPTQVCYPAMPVIVKTPAAPTVVCPPPVGAQGEWSIGSEHDGDRTIAIEARFLDSDG